MKRGRIFFIFSFLFFEFTLASLGAEYSENVTVDPGAFSAPFVRIYKEEGGIEVVWLKGGDEKWELQGAIKMPPDEPWASFSTGIYFNCPNPLFSISEEGNIAILDNAQNSLWVTKRFCSDKNFCPRVKVANSRAHEGKIAVGGKERIFLIWREDNLLYSFIQGAIMVNGQVSAVPLSSLKGCFEKPSLAACTNGEAIAVWLQRTPLMMKGVQFAFYTDESWSSSFFLSEYGGEYSAPLVSMNDLGQAVVAWVRNEKLQASTLDKTKRGWEYSSPKEIAAKGSFTSLGLALNSKGEGFLYWTEEGLLKVSVKKSGREESWSIPIAISHPGASVYSSALGFDEEGNPKIVFSENEGGLFTLYLCEKFPASEWSAPLSLSQPSTSDQKPSLFLTSSENGEAYAWLQTTAFGQTIQAVVKN